MKTKKNKFDEEIFSFSQKVLFNANFLLNYCKITLLKLFCMKTWWNVVKNLLWYSFHSKRCLPLSKSFQSIDYDLIMMLLLNMKLNTPENVWLFFATFYPLQHAKQQIMGRLANYSSTHAILLRVGIWK